MTTPTQRAWLDRVGTEFTLHFDKSSTGRRVSCIMWDDDNELEVRAIKGHHAGQLPANRFRADATLDGVARRCRCTVCGWRRAEVRPDYSRQQTAPANVGWMTPPGIS